MRSQRRATASRAAVLALIAVAFGLGFGLGRWTADPQPSAPLAAPAAEASAPVAETAPPPRPPEASPRPGDPVASEPDSAGPRIALVIDDLGRSVETVEQLRALGVALTYAVLPFESRSPEVVAHLTGMGLETLCHVPMEAQLDVDPGPGALRRTMSGSEIRSATARALAAVPNAVGVNNHMGSAFSEDPGSMTPFLEVVAEHGLYFLDSRTSAETQGLAVARALGMRAVERNVFLDGERSPHRIRAEFRRALALSSEEGPAVVIGHPYGETLEVLGEEVPRAVALGFRFVTLSQVVADG